MRGVLPLLIVGVLLAQESPKLEPPKPVFQTRSDEVLVDLVIRDKRGKLPRELAASSLTVLENGVPQTITSFRLVTPSTADAKTAPLRLVSIVFDALSLDARRIARNAALDFLRADYGPNAYYAVFIAGSRLQPVLPYTHDLERIKAALLAVTGAERTPIVAPLRDPVSPFHLTPTQDSGGGLLFDFAGVVNSMLEFNGRLDNEMFGRASVFSLWGVVNELGRLPGRKSLLYFSMGLRLPENRSLFLSLLSAANRANVSVYPIDARGLSTGLGDSNASERPMPNLYSQEEAYTGSSAAARSVSTAADSHGAVLSAMYANLQQNLHDLAASTGGALLANSNDYGPHVRKLSEEINTFYELTYRPPTLNYDGRFRAITVKSSNPSLKIQSRDGYFALPPMEGQAVFPFEVPLLHALGAPTLPRDLEFRARVLQYRDSASLVFDLPTGQVAFKPAKDPAKSKTHVTFLALVKDERGQVVAKLSRDLPVEVPTARLPEYRSGRWIFTRPFPLKPGRYTVESAISDNLANKLSARRSVLVVTPPEASPRLSDLALVRRVDPLPDPADPQDPLQLPTGRVVPTLADQFPAGQIDAFLSLYPATASPQLVLDLLREGKPVRREQPPLPAAEKGAVPVIARVSTAGLTPGQYELRAAFIEDGKASVRTVPITIQ
jgi:VWFA-related protein